MIPRSVGTFSSHHFPKLLQTIEELAPMGTDDDENRQDGISSYQSSGDLEPTSHATLQAGQSFDGGSQWIDVGRHGPYKCPHADALP